MPLNNPIQEVEISTGQYTGDNTVNRAIPHGMRRKPAFIVINSEDQAIYNIISKTSNYIYMIAGDTLQTVTEPDSTNFYVGNAANQTQAANANTKVYDWVAFA